MMTVTGAMSCGPTTPASVLIRPSWLITMKWVTISAWIGTMKLARIIHQKSRRPGEIELRDRVAGARRHHHDDAP